MPREHRRELRKTQGRVRITVYFSAKQPQGATGMQSRESNLAAASEETATSRSAREFWRPSGRSEEQAESPSTTGPLEFGEKIANKSLQILKR